MLEMQFVGVNGKSSSLFRITHVFIILNSTEIITFTVLFYVFLKLAIK
jgi:hypothetical protein